VIARTWRGWAPTTTAEDYRRHYETEVAEQLRNVPGFRGAHLLRHQEGNEVLFTSITFFASMRDVQAFAGARPDLAVVEETARRALSHWDHQVTHHEVAVDLQN
jgi:heme-degrading monooxygenase HmoA